MRKRTVLTAVLGVLVVGVGLVLAVLSPAQGEDVPLGLAVVLGLFVFGLAVYKLARTPGGESLAPPPWTEGGSLVEDRPESTPEEISLSGTALVGVVDTAAETARDSETVEDGLSVVREPLRETLVATLRQGGWSDARIDDALAEGTWTDDPVAAAVLDERVTPPERSLRRRLWAWLFPHRAVRHRTALAVGAVARAADRALPAVVGQRAPRPKPVPEPRLEELQRAADGELRRAVEGEASMRPPTEAAGSDGRPTDEDWATPGEGGD